MSINLSSFQYLEHYILYADRKKENDKLRNFATLTTLMDVSVKSELRSERHRLSYAMIPRSSKNSERKYFGRELVISAKQGACDSWASSSRLDIVSLVRAYFVSFCPRDLRVRFSFETASSRLHSRYFAVWCVVPYIPKIIIVFNISQTTASYRSLQDSSIHKSFIFICTCA